MTWQSAEYEVKGEIMKTDVYIRVFSETHTVSQMEADIEQAFLMFRDFEMRFSRFRPESEVSRLNVSSTFHVSDELFDILIRSKAYFEETNGIFDPTILATLLREGYGSSFGTNEFGRSGRGRLTEAYTFSDVSLDVSTHLVMKPELCLIDLGGIGKGYIVDRVAEKLACSYTNFIVDAGGDMYVSGRDCSSSYPSFAIEIENAHAKQGGIGLLMVSDQAVATSGVNRRRWKQAGGKTEKSHLIDVERRMSTESDLLTTTAVAKTAERADVMAKTLCLLGSERARLFAEDKHIPAFFILKDGIIETNTYMQPFIWKGNNGTF